MHHDRLDVIGCAVLLLDQAVLIVRTLRRLNISLSLLPVHVRVRGILQHSAVGRGSCTRGHVDTDLHIVLMLFVHILHLVVIKWLRFVLCIDGCGLC